MGVGSLTAPLVPLAPFLCYALPKIGTQRRDFTDMVRLIDAHTGGISLSGTARTRFDSAGIVHALSGGKRKMSVTQPGKNV